MLCIQTDGAGRLVEREHVVAVGHREEHALAAGAVLEIERRRPGVAGEARREGRRRWPSRGRRLGQRRLDEEPSRDGWLLRSSTESSAAGAPAVPLAPPPDPPVEPAAPLPAPPDGLPVEPLLEQAIDVTASSRPQAKRTVIVGVKVPGPRTRGSSKMPVRNRSAPRARGPGGSNWTCRRRSWPGGAEAAIADLDGGTAPDPEDHAGLASRRQPSSWSKTSIRPARPVSAIANRGVEREPGAATPARARSPGNRGAAGARQIEPRGERIDDEDAEACRDDDAAGGGIAETDAGLRRPAIAVTGSTVSRLGRRRDRWWGRLGRRRRFRSRRCGRLPGTPSSDSGIVGSACSGVALDVAGCAFVGGAQRIASSRAPAARARGAIPPRTPRC